MIEFCIRRDMQARCVNSKKNKTKKHVREEKNVRNSPTPPREEILREKRGLRGRVAAKKSRWERAREKKRLEERGKKAQTLRWRT